jgi:hypothetical protein
MPVKKIFILLLLMLALNASSQVALSYYPFQSLVSLCTNTEKRVFGDYRVETNNFTSNMNMELALMINIRRKEVVNYYTGAGASFNPAYLAVDIDPMNGYFVTGGARIKPFEKSRSVHIIFEISPYINSKFTGGNLRSRLGLGYQFKKKSKDTEKKD